MASRWLETIDEEWWAEGMGVVLEARGVVYYGDSDERAGLGPFRSRLEAERALEEARDDAATDDP